MCHAFCHPSVKTLVFAGRARNPESPKLSECARMCPNVPECATNVLPNVLFFLKTLKVWSRRGGCHVVIHVGGLSCFSIYDFIRSPWQRFSTSRRSGRPLQSPIDIMVAIHGCSKVSKARTIMCPCLLPWGPWYACAEPFPNPNNSSLVQEHVCTIAGLLVGVITPEEFWLGRLQRSCKLCRHSPSHSVEKKGTPTVFLAGRRADLRTGGPESGPAHRPVEVGQHELQILRNFRTCL